MAQDENLLQKIQVQDHEQRYYLSWLKQNLEESEGHILDIEMVVTVFD